MLSSLRSWCNIPQLYKKCTGLLSTGEKAYTEATTIQCYKKGEAIVITDKHDNQVISMSQLYIPPEYVITEDDMFEDKGRFVEIKKIATFYDANTSKTDLYMVYL